ncbi:Nitroreductase [Salinibacillus kushneri]|uniref:Nitroreductase n=1 Tax=Salinibacillus kushneri TaxID=237682 RepID=A0A1I0F597_9BACI|nr:nitroreductase family protein [Salinibacillus kushneri]SET53218.1 Nitroreductase [Salinibacillus kushneri]
MSTKEMKQQRQADYDIDSIYLDRWSPRSFSEKEVPEEILMSVFEAARWAPSAMNMQPWRFIIARNQEDREKFHSFIMEGNLKWCKKAPVLAVIISNKEDGSHAFDTGTAWGYMSLEAWKKGLITHPMGGFHKDKAREVLNIPEEYDIQALIAIGYQGEKEDLPEDLQKREQRSERRPVKESVFEGKFE